MFLQFSPAEMRKSDSRRLLVLVLVLVFRIETVAISVPEKDRRWGLVARCDPARACQALSWMIATQQSRTINCLDQGGNSPYIPVR